MDNAKLTELERLLAAATPGMWEHDSDVFVLDAQTGFVAETWTESDAALIVAAVNALPQLIKRVRELEQSQRSDEPHEASGEHVTSG